jgi:enoyl-CoA hydratase/carnithine racemase
MHRLSAVVSSFASNDPIIFESINSIGYITLNRPESLNALDLNMMKALQDQLFVKNTLFE